MKSPSRLDSSALARWFWSVDHISLALIAAIAMIGFVVLLAAGPAAAARLGIENSFHFPLRQILFLIPALTLMLGVSMLTPLQARRLGAIVFAAALVLLLATLVLAPEVNGAKRWISLGGFGLQPSELAKPGFVIVAAWMLAEGVRNPKFPGALVALALYGAVMGFLLMQPDYGQAALLTAAWMVMFFIIGWSWAWIIGIGGVGLGAMVIGYFFSPHLARRIDAYLNPDAAGAYQVDKSVEAFANGGLFGKSGEGATVKMQLPDAHADFIFAVAGEEGGFILCAIIIAIFGALTLRFFFRAAQLKTMFAQCAVCGLAALVGLQSIINMGVSLRALPAKGMTLPLISYGGSSLLATGLTLGLILALTRAHGPALRRKDIMP